MMMFKKKKQQPVNEMTPTELKEWYSLVPDPDNADAEYWCMRLEKGDFAGVIYKYGEIGIRPELNEDGTLPVKFEFDILFIPEELRTKEFGDEVKKEFETLLGNIMMAMIQEDLESKERGEYGAGGDDDSEKFVVRRRIHTGDNSFSKD